MNSQLSIKPTLVGGLSGIILENEKLRLVVMPEFGARIISLIYKPTETEFAWHCTDVPIGRPSYQIEYENVSGFFDCVPTCETCTFKGRKLPPLGDVASEPWDLIEKKKNGNTITIRMEKRCASYPLLIRKKVSMSETNPAVYLDYELFNLSNEEIEFHYSGHNTMPTNPHFKIVLPPEVSSLKVGTCATDRLGSTGDEISWPITKDKSGKAVDLSRAGTPCDGTAENLYTPKLKNSWCAAVNEARREAISFLFSAQILPYILLWLNYGGWRGYYHIALEPCTGRPDNLETAVNNWKNYAVLKPREKKLWSQIINIAHNIRHIEKVTVDDGIVQ
jgi:galactose mutarotase-like enzyme